MRALLKGIAGVAFAGSFLACGMREAPAADLARTVTIDGTARTYTLFIPDRVRAARQPAPTVFVVHGGLGTGSQIRKHLGFDSIAEREGVIAVYPDGLDRSWNDGRTDLQKRRGGEPDDVAFLRAIARALKEERLALSGRVYVVGVSNGGMMAFRLACDAAEEFDGIATIIANLGLELSRSCKPSRPVPVLLIQATKDPLMPWEGGGVGFRGKRGEVVSADATATFWGKVLDCETQARTSELPHRLADDITRVRREVRPCKNGRLERLIVIDGGHQVPRVVQSVRLFDKFLGPANHDIDAAEMTWTFFSAGKQP